MTRKSTSPVWHPFTQHGAVESFPVIARAEGSYLYDDGGRRIIDAISSWWVTTHGHCHPRIQAAIAEAAGGIDQIIFANFTHEAAEQLARELVEITPAGLDHVFFTDSGATSVEVALKMALGYWHNLGEPRHRIVTMEHGYHGDTAGAMSAGARSVFNAAYEPLLFEVDVIPFPEPGRAQQTLDALEALCVNDVRKPAAFIVEPLVLGAGGMRMYPASVLREMSEVCWRHDVLLIADEVMTGWGRTGEVFACDKAGITPDIACYGKGLTGGALPLAVTMCRARIFEAHLSPDRARMFFHSSSYTANPLACAAARANLAVWREEQVRERIFRLTEIQAAAVARMTALQGVESVRQTGTITAFDIRSEEPGYLNEIGPRLYSNCLDRGVLVRPLGSTVYVMPPYCTTAADLGQVYDAISAALEGARS